MATIYKEFLVDAPTEFVWDAIKDVSAVYSRLAREFSRERRSRET